MYAVISEFFDFNNPQYNEVNIISFHAALDSARSKVEFIKNSDEYKNLEETEKVIIRIVKMDVIEEA